MSEVDGKRQWVERVLGVSFLGSDAGPQAFPKLWAAAKERWQSAIETVDGQVGKLQSALRAQVDTELTEIAEFGLNGVTGNFKVRVMAAMRDVDGADPSKRVAMARKAEALVSGFQSFLNDDPRIAACDGNPFGVAMSIRASLGGALSDLSRALAVA